MSPPRFRRRLLPAGPPRRARFVVLLALAVLGSLLASTPIPIPAAGAEAPLPSFGDARLLLDPGDQAWNGGGSQQPAIVATDGLDGALGAYHLYYGSPNEGGIGLAWSDAPDGPFTPYADNPVVADASGPHAVVVDGELRLYHHSSKTSIDVSISGDGVTFGAAADVLDAADVTGPGEIQLPRVFAHTAVAGDPWTMLFMGNDGGTRRIYAATSSDGLTFTPLDRPVVSPGDGEGGQIASPHLLEHDGRTLVVYHSAAGAVHAAEVGPDLDLENHLGVLHQPLAGDPDRGKAAAPAFLTVDGETWLYYDAGSPARIALSREGGDRPPEPEPVDFPEFSHVGTVVDADTSPTGEYIFPSVIGTGHLRRPHGRYYLYYGPHENPGGIYLASADSPAGPWTPVSDEPVVANVWPGIYDVSHVSSPHAVWNHEAGRLYLYFHGENDVTRVASSRDGIHFRYEGEAVTTDMFEGLSETSYARVFRYRLPSVGNRWTMLLMGNQGGTRKIFYATSDDGLSWNAVAEPLISPGQGENGQISGPWLYPYRGRMFVLHHSAAGAVHATEVGRDFSLEHHHGEFFRSSTGLRAAAPSFLTVRGTTYLFYEMGPRLQATIAYATSRTRWGMEPETSALRWRGWSGMEP